MSSVAVVIPVFNRNDLLVRAMKSVAAQETGPAEVLIVDDASSDDMSYCRSMAEEFGFRWLPLKANAGPSAARNAGVLASSSEWICFLDSDDEWMPAKVRTQIQWHRDHPAYRISQVHETWQRQGQSVKKPSHWSQKGGDLFSASVERCSVGPSCVMLSRQLWNEHGGFDESFRVCEDYELWLRITARETVGLVEGDSLVRKHGGHADQLSVVVEAMDRFRVHALIKLLMTADLEERRRMRVVEGISTKANILAQGAIKRGMDRRAVFYQTITKVDWSAVNDEQIQEWFDRSAEFLEE